VKLTPQSQGYRFRKSDWPPDKWVDVKKVGRFIIEGEAEDGTTFLACRDEKETDWVRLGSSTKLKQ
jgi:hypothetical protein